MRSREWSPAQSRRLAVPAAIVGLLLAAAAGALGEESGVAPGASEASERALAEELDALREESLQLDQELTSLNDYNRYLGGLLELAGDSVEESASERALHLATVRG